MAGEWIKVEAATADKPEVLRIARILRIDHDAVFGKLVRLWSWIDTNSVDGVVDGVVDQDIDRLCHCAGFTAACVTVGWLNYDADGERVSLPNFERHNGETAKQRALKNRRQAKWRAGVDADVDAKPSTPATTREEKRREEKKETKATQPKAAKARKTTLPEGFALSERVKQWATEKGHIRLDDRFEHFVSSAKAKGYEYADWDEALMNAVRNDWAKLGTSVPSQNVAGGGRREL